MARKHLSHPPLSTFEHFGCLDRCTRAAELQAKPEEVCCEIFDLEFEIFDGKIW